MTTQITFKCPEDVKRRVEEEALRRGITVTQVMLQATDDFLRQDNRKRNYDAINAKLDKIEAEVVKGQALTRRYLDHTVGKEKSDQILEAARRDAVAHLHPGVREG